MKFFDADKYKYVIVYIVVMPVFSAPLVSSSVYPMHDKQNHISLKLSIEFAV